MQSEIPNTARRRGSDQFVVLITDAQMSLFSYLQTLIPNAADARDVLQETNLALWDKHAEYDPSRPFWPWACQFAKNQALAYMKRYSRDRHQFGNELVDLLAVDAARRNETFDRELTVLDRCLEKLGERGREMLRMRYHQAMPCNKLAEKLNRSPGAVRDALYRLRMSVGDCIRQALAAEQGGER